MTAPPDPIRLDGRTALVTGAAGDIGQAVMLQLAARGAAIVGLDRDGAALDRALAALPRDVRRRALCADITDDDAMADCAAQGWDWSGGIQILCNAAGIEGPVTPLHMLTPDAFRRVLEVNVIGTFIAMRHLLPRMAAAGTGSVVNIASVAGLRATPQMAAYGASKHAVIGLTSAASLEVAGRGVRVNSVCPGAIAGHMTARIAAGRAPADQAAALEGMARKTPMGRRGTPAEVAHLVAFLASDAAAYITGSHHVVDGGRSAP